MSKIRKYSKDAMDKAIIYVANNEGSIRSASTLFDVPRASIQFKIKYPHTKFKPGPNTILTDTEERALADFIIKYAKLGFPLNKDNILSCVAEFLRANPRNNPFTKDRPGDSWFRCFLRRHPDVVERKSEGVTNSSACVSEQNIKKWFESVKKYILEENLTHVIEDPSRIFNADETGFNLCPKTGKVLAQRGSKNVYQIEKAPVKESITVMFSFSANGSTGNPLIIYPYKKIPGKIAESVPTGWGIGKSDNGWMTACTFYEYIANVFYPQLVLEKVAFPVILFVDGHKSHLTLEVAKLCKELQIHLIALYPNATRILQPADVAAFRPIKNAWQKGLREWYDKNNYQKSLNKLTFAPLLKTILDNTIHPESLINGFRVCGLYPFDDSNVDYSKCLAKNKEENENTSTTLRNAEYKMSYTDFCEVVWEEIINKCYSYEGDCNKDLFLVHKLWKKFHSSENYDMNKPYLDDSNYTAEDLESGQNLAEGKKACEKENGNKIPELILDETTGNLLDVNNKESNIVLDETTGNLLYMNNEESNILLDETTGLICNRLHVNNGESKCMSEETLKDVITDTVQDKKTSQSGSHHLKSSLAYLSAVERNVHIVSNDLLVDYLSLRKWPGKLERTGKRQIERLPYAITSNAFINLMSDKKQKLEEKEKEKENRKRAREEKKAIKENETISKKRKVNLNKNFKQETEVNADILSTTIEAKAKTIKTNTKKVEKKEPKVNVDILSTATEAKAKKVKANTKKVVKEESKVNADIRSTILESKSKKTKVNLKKNVIQTKPKQVKINTKNRGSDENTSIKKSTDNSILNVGEPSVSSEVVHKRDKCEICTLNIVGHNNELLCLRCSKYFHEECVPLFHENRIPLVGPYICHICYHLQASSSSDSEN